MTCYLCIDNHHPIPAKAHCCPGKIPHATHSTVILGNETLIFLRKIIRSNWPRIHRLKIALWILGQGMLMFSFGKQSIALPRMTPLGWLKGCYQFLRTLVRESRDDATTVELGTIHETHI